MEEVTLRPDQIEDLATLICNPRHGLASDPGTGKTPTVCAYMRYLWDTKQTKSIWPQPKSLMFKNRLELIKFGGFRPEEVVILKGTKAQRLKLIMNPLAKVFICSFTGFANEWRLMRQWHPQINAIIVDEYHLGFKTATSQRSQELLECYRRTGANMKYFVPMSGTFVAGRLDSAYVAIKIINPVYYANHWDFLAQHGIHDFFGNVIGWKNHEKLGEIFSRHFIRRTFESIHGNQDPLIVPELVEMSPKQRAAYNEFHEKALLELEDYMLTGATGGVFTMRCRQIAAHPHAYGLLKDGELTGKEEALEVHFENHKDSGKPLIVFASLVPEQERIRDLAIKCGLRVGFINGSVSATKRDEIDRAFQAGELDVVVGSPATMAVGYNWNHVDHVIFASIDYQDDNFIQAYRRAIRGKRETKLLVHVLEYADSVDQPMFVIVNVKSEHRAKVDSSYNTLELGADRLKQREQVIKELTETAPDTSGGWTLDDLR